MTKATTKSGGKKSTTKPAVKSASNRSAAAKTVSKKTSKSAKPAAKAPGKSSKTTRPATKATSKAATKPTKAAASKAKSSSATSGKSTGKSTRAASKGTTKATSKSTTKSTTKSRSKRTASTQIDVKVGSLAAKPGSFSLGSRNGNGLSFLDGKPGSSADGDAAGSGEPKLTRTKLTAKELRNFRELLLTKRRQLLGDMDSMESEALRTEGTNLSHLPVHMADMGTDNYEQEFTLSLVDRDRKVIDEIDHALKKIDDKTYGICEGTGQMIAKPRLESVPWTRYGIEYARRLQQPSFRR